MARFLPPLLGLFFALTLVTAAQAHYVIPYELRIGEGADQKRYTVIVVLADHYAHHFGEQDGLSQLLANNYHHDTKSFLNGYLKVPYNWYLDQLAKNPRVYGNDAGPIADGLRQFESMADGRTSAVIITEYQKLDQVLAFLRVDTADANGLLTSEAHFKDKGLGGQGFPKPVPSFEWNRISNFQPESYQTEFHRLNFPNQERLHFWLEGENIEMKNFAMDPRTMRKFFKHLYFIARAHKMFIWGAQTFPAEITAWPFGTSITKEAATRFGRRVSHVWLDAYSEILMRYYQGLGFDVWKKINNKHTKNRDLYFMVAPVRVLESTVGATVLNRFSKEESWLIRSDELTATLHFVKCADELLKIGSQPEGKKGAKGN